MLPLFRIQTWETPCKEQNPKKIEYKSANTKPIVECAE